MSDKPTVAAARLPAQHGVPPETIRRALTHNINGSASGPHGTVVDLLTWELWSHDAGPLLRQTYPAPRPFED